MIVASAFIRRLSCTAIVAGALSVSAVAASPPAKLALTGARIIPVSGPEIERGTILIEHGIITAVGPDVRIPFDAMEVELDGMTIMPGMIDPDSFRGLDVPNENVPIVPFLDVYDAIDPSRLFFEESLRIGVTSVHVMQGPNTVVSAQSRVVRPIGLSMAEMIVAPPVALKLVTSPRSGSDRMQQMATLREAMRRLEDDTRRLAERKYEEKVKKEGGTVDVSPDEAAARGMELLRDEDHSDGHRVLTRMVQGDIRPWFHASEAMDVLSAVRFAREHELLEHAVFIVGSESHRAVDLLKETGRPVVLPPDLHDRRRNPETDELEETFLPAVFHRAGIPFALQPNPDASLAERYLTFQAALCVRAGIPREVALRSITLTPAEMLGMEEMLGSIETGKIANLVVMTGDPLSFDSWVEFVYIDGVLAYDRSRDHRLQRLLRPGAADSDENGEEFSAPRPEGESAPRDGSRRGDIRRRGGAGA